MHLTQLKMEPDKVHLRYSIFYHFNWSKTTARIKIFICEVYGKNIVSVILSGKSNLKDLKIVVTTLITSHILVIQIRCTTTNWNFNESVGQRFCKTSAISSVIGKLTAEIKQNDGAINVNLL